MSDLIDRLDYLARVFRTYEYDHADLELAETLPVEAAAEITRLRAKVEAADRLEDALKEVTQALVWQSFGECRGYSEILMAPRKAVEVSKSALTAYKEAAE